MSIFSCQNPAYLLGPAPEPSIPEESGLGTLLLPHINDLAIIFNTETRGQAASVPLGPLVRRQGIVSFSLLNNLGSSSQKAKLEAGNASLT